MSTTIVYLRAIAEAWRGNLDVVNDDIRALAVDPDAYTPDDAEHDFLDDVPGAARIGTAVAVDLTVSDDAEIGSTSPEVTDPTEGDSLARVVFYRHNAAEGSALLVFCYSAFREAPLPSNGEAVTFNLPAILARFRNAS